MTWAVLAILGLAALALGLLVGLPRRMWTGLAAALLFGFAGYALVGSPDRAGAPKAGGAARISPDLGEAMVSARRDAYGADRQPSFYVTMADGFARRGQLADAAGLLGNAVEENPHDAEAWLALANVLLEEGGGRLAPPSRYAYARAIENARGHPAPGFFLGLALIRSDQPEEALALWRESLARTPADAEWRGQLAQRVEALEAILAAQAEAGRAGPESVVAPPRDAPPR